MSFNPPTTTFPLGAVTYNPEAIGTANAVASSLFANVQESGVLVLGNKNLHVVGTLVYAAKGFVDGQEAHHGPGYVFFKTSGNHVVPSASIYEALLIGAGLQKVDLEPVPTSTAPVAETTIALPVSAPMASVAGPAAEPAVVPVAVPTISTLPTSAVVAGPTASVPIVTAVPPPALAKAAVAVAAPAADAANDVDDDAEYEEYYSDEEEGEIKESPKAGPANARPNTAGQEFPFYAEKYLHPLESLDPEQTSEEVVPSYLGKLGSIQTSDWKEIVSGASFQHQAKVLPPYAGIPKPDDAPYGVIVAGMDSKEGSGQDARTAFHIIEGLFTQETATEFAREHRIGKNWVLLTPTKASVLEYLSARGLQTLKNGSLDTGSLTVSSMLALVNQISKIFDIVALPGYSMEEYENYFNLLVGFLRILRAAFVTKNTHARDNSDGQINYTRRALQFAMERFVRNKPMFDSNNAIIMNDDGKPKRIRDTFEDLRPFVIMAFVFGYESFDVAERPTPFVDVLHSASTTILHRFEDPSYGEDAYLRHVLAYTIMRLLYENDYAITTETLMASIEPITSRLYNVEQ